ncbi:MULTISPECIES: Gx transporter family protein [Pelosinus]|uniref:Heptaprenyl diphosphate synthase component I n=1 Tax=Pelosinus fermentans B4 TaxID=1149862 RepID=I9AVS7_9FIRM|nr:MULTISPECIES: Gx transporter family protein [Pelosinus]EIW17017.1 Heptaprenyl diphosphate synthase component I [Pelosinus fermentans B4]EIW23184.1 Heptaprenyl diphosphate synthase component I [Pelosinus fermentans A11]OAM93772.1 Heptaprenyl diphosphate synthase component I [Pelosinus fermentans DSM 17108]SDQ89589.1 heptaprenyl diphosphate synthase [Pelosinus fermentans]
MNHTRRVVLMALFVAIASVLHIVESWIPLPLPIPGIKLGLANIVSLITIATFGWREAIYVVVIRVFLASLFGGILIGPAFAMSMSGAIASTLLMAYAYTAWHSTFSFIGISIIGAVMHGIAQIIMAALVVSSLTLLWYLPYLVLLAVPTGWATGMTVAYFLAKAPRSMPKPLQ